MTEPERLQKVLARAGIASRRRVEEMIVAGRIRVNGAVAELGQRVDVSKDKVEVDGGRVPLAPDLVYLLLNKPVGVVSTSADPQGRATVLDVVDLEARVWAVGRLDVGSEGAILLTNDGELTEHLTHPRNEVEKTYLVGVHKGVPERALRELRRGVQLEDGPARARSLKVLERGPSGTLVEITIAEGRNRQVRRMFEAVGSRVDRLVRTSIGPLMLGRLKPGQHRRLGPQEVQALFAAGAGEGRRKDK